MGSTDRSGRDSLEVLINYLTMMGHGIRDRGACPKFLDDEDD